MNKFFTKAPQWKIFLLLYVIPVLSYIFFIATFIIVAVDYDLYSPIVSYTLAFSFLFFLSINLYFRGHWFWAVIVSLNNKLPDTLKIDLKQFKWLNYVQIGVSVLFAFLAYITYQSWVNYNTLLTWYLLLLIPIIFFFAYSFFYTIIIAAKVYKTVELQRKVDLSDCILELFLFYMLSVGVWILQPKINAIVTESQPESETLLDS